MPTAICAVAPLPVTTATPVVAVCAGEQGAGPKVAVTVKTFFPEAWGVNVPLIAQPREVIVLKLPLDWT